MPNCTIFDNDVLFQNIRLIEFPVTFINATTVRTIECESPSLETTYFKTLHNNKLMTLSEASLHSPDHRAFKIFAITKSSFKVTFHPSDKCLIKGWKHIGLPKEFVIDVHVMKGDMRNRCCRSENHSEVARFYVYGRCEICKLSSEPKLIEFGCLKIPGKSSSQIMVRNESQLLPIRIEYVKVAGYAVKPMISTIPAKETVALTVNISLWSKDIKRTIKFVVKTMADKGSEIIGCHSIEIRLDPLYQRRALEKPITSLHLLNEPDWGNTLTSSERLIKNNLKAVHNADIRLSKTCSCLHCGYSYTPGIEECFRHKYKCSVSQAESSVVHRFSRDNLCDIILEPDSLNFGDIAVTTKEKLSVSITNKSNHKVTLKFRPKNHFTYFINDTSTLTIDLKPMSETNIEIFFHASNVGRFHEYLEYDINNEFHCFYTVDVNVEKPHLILSENKLKFGNVGKDGFITDLHVMIKNSFNIKLFYMWKNINEIPFQIFPTKGEVPARSCMICEILYLPLPIYRHNFTVTLESWGTSEELELYVQTRKTQIRFITNTIDLRDIPLNVTVCRQTLMENISRETVTYEVANNPVNGFTLSPRSGYIEPKSLVTFTLSAKIPLLVRFSVEFNVKINNKEFKTLTVVGHVTPPKISIEPKCVQGLRIPCGLVAYVPFTFHNAGSQKSFVNLSSEDPPLKLYAKYNSDFTEVEDVCLEKGRSEKLYLRLRDTEIRAYNMSLPYKINNIAGPPDANVKATCDLQYFLPNFSSFYENMPTIRMDKCNNDMYPSKMFIIFTKSLLTFHPPEFLIEYTSLDDNITQICKIKNVSDEEVDITINVDELWPRFHLALIGQEEEQSSLKGDIKTTIESKSDISLNITHMATSKPSTVSTAQLFIKGNYLLPFHNLQFRATLKQPEIVSSSSHIYFAPMRPKHFSRKLIKLELVNHRNDAKLTHHMQPETQLLNIDYIRVNNEENCNVQQVEIAVSSEDSAEETINLVFETSMGASCRILVSYTFTSCPLSIYHNVAAENQEPSFPFFPTAENREYFVSMTATCAFLEKWLYYQGYKKELYPKIPDTFYVISSNFSAEKISTLRVSYLNLVKHIAGNAIFKYLQSFCPGEATNDELSKILTVYKMYQEITTLLKKRNASLPTIQPEYLLEYEQYCIYIDKLSGSKSVFSSSLKNNRTLFYSYSKQCWIDLILQTYKAFILLNCFFDCQCIEKKAHDIEGILISWYNEALSSRQHVINKLLHPDGSAVTRTTISNLTDDLMDGIALAAVTLDYCAYLEPFLKDLKFVSNGLHADHCAVHNAALIIKAWEHVNLVLPIKASDFKHPNLVLMVFLSVHLYVVLPSLTQRSRVSFETQLLHQSRKRLTLQNTSPESITYTAFMLNNTKNVYSCEKTSYQCDPKMKVGVIIKFTAKFLENEQAILVFKGNNKSRIFDTYLVFLLDGKVVDISPVCCHKIVSPRCRIHTVSLTITAPFTETTTCNVYLTHEEPTLPVAIEEPPASQFVVRRFKLLQSTIEFMSINNDDACEQQLLLVIYCLSTQIRDCWIWFRGSVGDFYVKLTSMPRTDVHLESLTAKMGTWPTRTCNCGPDCECYRTGVLKIEFKNKRTVDALRTALKLYASPTMLELFDKYFETPPGRAAIRMLLAETGSDVSVINPILAYSNTFSVSVTQPVTVSENKITLSECEENSPLMITLPAESLPEKVVLTLVSDCGRDLRAYKIDFVEDEDVLV